MDNMIFWNGEFKICITQPVNIYAWIHKNALEVAEISRFYGEKGFEALILLLNLRMLKNGDIPENINKYIHVNKIINDKKTTFFFI